LDSRTSFAQRRLTDDWKQRLAHGVVGVLDRGLGEPE
jgi:hypothetical protein